MVKSMIIRLSTDLVRKCTGMRESIDAKSVIKIAISTGLLFYLLIFVVDFSQLSDVVTRVNIRWYLVGYLFGVLGTVISVIRWREIIRSTGEPASFWSLLAIYYIGKFYNLLIPGSIGGDFVRAHHVSREEEKRVQLIATVPAERIAGLCGMVIVLSFVTPIAWGKVPKIIVLQALLAVLVIISGTLVLTSSRILDITFAVSKSIGLANYLPEEKIRNFLEGANIFNDLVLLVKVVALSVLFLLVSFLPTYFIGLSLGIKIPFLFLMAVMPIVTLISMLPISFGGIGIREGLYVYFFGLLGIVPSEAVAIGLVGFSIQVISALIGGILDIIDRL